jgi:L,D-peptidoglycan transpeptidase YkuD (ErfK/YbiS/YcfS/YnhG family)
MRIFFFLLIAAFARLDQNLLDDSSCTPLFCKAQAVSRKNTFVHQVVIHGRSVNGHKAMSQCGNVHHACSIGPAGIRLQKREGDGSTPAGIWPMRYVMYRPDRLMRPRTGLPVFRIRPDSGWCDDPASLHYNQPVRLPVDESHERLWREDGVYDLVVVIGHNDSPPVAGRGSAVFIHVQRPDKGATQGCIAFDRSKLLHMLETWSTSTSLFVRL